MVLCYMATKELYEVMKVSVFSAVYNNPNAKIYIICENDYIDGFQGMNVEFINVKKYIHLLKCNSPNINTQWGYMSLMRCALPYILKDEDKVLYLDIDTIVDRPINILWKVDLDDYYFSMAVEPGMSEKMNCYYYNAGVALFNLKKIREDGKDKEIMFAINNCDYEYPDQDCYIDNCIDHILVMDPTFNNGKVTEEFENAHIYHDTWYKGWNKMTYHRKYWLKYFRLYTDYIEGQD